MGGNWTGKRTQRDNVSIQKTRNECLSHCTASQSRIVKTDIVILHMPIDSCFKFNAAITKFCTPATRIGEWKINVCYTNRPLSYSFLQGVLELCKHTFLNGKMKNEKVDFYHVYIVNWIHAPLLDLQFIRILVFKITLLHAQNLSPAPP